MEIINNAKTNYDEIVKNSFYKDLENITEKQYINFIKNENDKLTTNEKKIRKKYIFNKFVYKDGKIYIVNKTLLSRLNFKEQLEEFNYITFINTTLYITNNRFTNNNIPLYSRDEFNVDDNNFNKLITEIINNYIYKIVKLNLDYKSNGLELLLRDKLKTNILLVLNLNNSNKYNEDAEYNDLIKKYYGMVIKTKKYKYINEFILKNIVLFNKTIDSFVKNDILNDYIKYSLTTNKKDKQNDIYKKLSKNTKTNNNFLIKLNELYDKIPLQNKKNFFNTENPQLNITYSNINKIINRLNETSILSFYTLNHLNKKWLKIYESFIIKYFNNDFLFNRYTFSNKEHIENIEDYYNIESKINIPYRRNKTILTEEFDKINYLDKDKKECEICFDNNNIRTFKICCSNYKCNNTICLKCVGKCNNCPFCRSKFNNNINKLYSENEFYRC